MRIRAVTARAFGPLAGETLEFAPGLNVVWGPNEAGKSSWHAAIYAGLCGLRRARGARTQDDREFEKRHRPWGGGGRWQVEVVLELDDERVVDLSQDLKQRIGRALDNLGRDVTAEIMGDGSPDGARWLGLDRRTFLATACVRQGDLPGVAREASTLQVHLQRAAAPGGAAATAASALERIRRFRADHVGSDRANAVGPLRRAKERVSQAGEGLRIARERHAEYLDLAEQARELRRRADQAKRRAAAARAAAARREAESARAAAARARELATRYGKGPPEGDAEEDALARDVEAALARWEARPAIPSLEGPSAAELGRELRAAEELAAAAPGASAERLRRSAEELEASLPPVDPELEERVAAAEAAVRAARTRQRPALLATGLVALVAAAALAATTSPAAAVAAAAVGLALLALGLLRAGSPGVRELEELRAAEGALAEARHLRQAAEGRRRKAEEELSRLGLAADPVRLRRVADAIDAVPLLRLRAETRARDEEAAEQIRKAQDALCEVGRRLGLPGGGDELAQALRGWQQGRAERLKERDAARAEWGELQALLAGGTVEGLERRADDLERRAADLAARCAPEDLDRASGEEPVEDLAAEATRRDKEAAAADGRLDERRKSLPDVAEAEEELAAAKAELERVERLAATLDRTRELLEGAAARAHRGIAPHLAEAVRRHLGAVTQGRYVDVRVDPEKLVVTVREANGDWREADLLSAGTREQVYLLLRGALADVLAPEEICPLFLDDVTSRSDDRRAEAVLATLRALSEKRQVILFAHDQRVLEWAQRELAPPRDRLICLSPARRMAASSPA
jgi:exonuclease SbcC